MTLFMFHLQTSSNNSRNVHTSISFPSSSGYIYIFSIFLLRVSLQNNYFPGKYPGYSVRVGIQLPIRIALLGQPRNEKVLCYQEENSSRWHFIHSWYVKILLHFSSLFILFSTFVHLNYIRELKTYLRLVQYT